MNTCDTIKCEWITWHGRGKGSTTKCAADAKWKCPGKRREHCYCDAHKQEFLDAARDRAAEARRWSPL